MTIYGDKAALLKAMGITNEKVIHAVVVERSGRIVARTSGAYSAAGGAQVLAALGR